MPHLVGSGFSVVSYDPEHAAVSAVSVRPLLLLSTPSEHSVLETVTEFEHATVRELPAEVIITEAVLVPVVVYVFETVRDVPERLLVPLHEYVYEPLPPEGVAVHVVDCPIKVEEGDALHEPPIAG